LWRNSGAYFRKIRTPLRLIGTSQLVMRAPAAAAAAVAAAICERVDRTRMSRALIRVGAFSVYADRTRRFHLPTYRAQYFVTVTFVVMAICRHGDRCRPTAAAASDAEQLAAGPTSGYPSFRLLYDR